MENEKLTAHDAFANACYLAARDKTVNRADFLKLARVYFDLLRDAVELGFGENALEVLSKGPL
jgi:hypothetical protein